MLKKILSRTASLGTKVQVCDAQTLKKWVLPSESKPNTQRFKAYYFTYVYPFLGIHMKVRWTNNTKSLPILWNGLEHL